MSTMKIAQPTTNAARSGLRSTIARHPLAAFFTLAGMGALATAFFAWGVREPGAPRGETPAALEAAGAARA